MKKFRYALYRSARGTISSLSGKAYLGCETFRYELFYLGRMSFVYTQESRFHVANSSNIGNPS